MDLTSFDVVFSELTCILGECLESQEAITVMESQVGEVNAVAQASTEEQPTATEVPSEAAMESQEVIPVMESQVGDVNAVAQESTKEQPTGTRGTIRSCYRISGSNRSNGITNRSCKCSSSSVNRGTSY